MLLEEAKILEGRGASRSNNLEASGPGGEKMPFTVVRQDITKNVEAIVNAANTSLQRGGKY